jgi:serine/threonine protein kinase
MFNDIKSRPLFFDESKVTISKEAKDLLSGLIRKNPNERLGTNSHT